MSDMAYMAQTKLSFENVATMYSALNEEKQKEVYDFLSFLFSQNIQTKKPLSPKDSYSAVFFDLFGSCTDESFVEPKDCVDELREDELF